MNTSWNPDPMGYVGELRDSLCRLLGQLRGLSGADIGVAMPGSQPDPRTAEFGSAAYLVIMNLGFCRLYGIDVPTDLATQIREALSPEVICTAARVLASVLTTAIEDAEALPSRFDDSEAIEDQSICTEVLHQLMDFWAVFVVIDDEYQSRMCKEAPLGDLSATMDGVLEGFQALDDLLQREERLRLLSVATELPLLEHWRRMLAAPFRETPPWWIDGTLEAVAQATSREILSQDAYLFRPGVAAQPSVNCQRSFPVFGEVLAEYAARETHYATAAASQDNTRTPAHAALAKQKFRVEGDEDVQVKLNLDLFPTSAPAAAEISVLKGGPANKKEQYVRCEVAILGLPGPLVAELGTTVGKVCLTETQFSALREHYGSIGLTLLTADGTRRAVLPS
jgi:hypothetical protein